MWHAQIYVYTHTRRQIYTSLPVSNKNKHTPQERRGRNIRRQSAGATTTINTTTTTNTTTTRQKKRGGCWSIKVGSFLSQGTFAGAVLTDIHNCRTRRPGMGKISCLSVHEISLWKIIKKRKYSLLNTKTKRGTWSHVFHRVTTQISDIVPPPKCPIACTITATRGGVAPCAQSFTAARAGIMLYSHPL